MAKANGCNNFAADYPNITVLTGAWSLFELQNTVVYNSEHLSTYEDFSDLILFWFLQ